MKFESDKKEVRSQLVFNDDGTISLPDSILRDKEREQKVRKLKIKEDDLDIWDDPAQDDEKHNTGDDVFGFNLYNDGKKLNPLIFSNNKSQSDVVDEVVNHINNGKKVIFIRGVCGTGKSAIALNIGKKLGRASIVVPGKSLQRQYHDDYSISKYVLRNDHKKLKIKVISGRDNHACKFMPGKTANDSLLPCKIEIKESNYGKLQEYLKQNPKVKDDLELKDIRRISVAPVCPYWSPVVPSELDLPLKADKKSYASVKGKYTIYNRKAGCGYYEQFNSYISNEIIVFNSMKYKLEMLMNRKPKTDVDIIDEADEFLDAFSNSRRINLTRLYNSLSNVFPEGEDHRFVINKIGEIILGLIKNTGLGSNVYEIKDTKMHALFRYILDNPKLLDYVDEEHYLNSVYETVYMFEDFLDETFVSYSKEDRGTYAEIVTTNLEKKFNELLDKVESLVLMSGTLHSENILKNVFGISDYVVVDAEVLNQGTIEPKSIGIEVDCKYENFSKGIVNREKYLKILDEVVAKAPRPSLVHVNAFEDLPTESEKMIYGLHNVMSREKIRQLQEDDKVMIKKFKDKQVPVLFTTRCSRGVDFPKEQCNSIIFTKYPNPNVRGIFWKILGKTHSNYYWEVYKDKAKREFLQKIYRGVRSKDDHVYVLSPDLRVLETLEELKGEI